MSNWTEELFDLMVKKHIDRLNPDKGQTPEQMQKQARLLNAAFGGTEEING